VSIDFIWWSATALEGVALSRGLITGLLRKYSLFYLYVLCTFLSDVARFSCYRFAPTFYPELYWYSELVTIVASYAVVIEIFRQSFSHTPGVAGFTRRLLSVVFVLTFTYASLDFFQHGSASILRTIADLGRDLRYVEGSLLLIMLWLFTRYRIPVGSNLMGLILGNTFWIGVNILNLVFWSTPGNESSTLLRGLRGLSYVVTLAVWCVTLWSVQPDPVQPTEHQIERDYETLATKTRTVLARTSHRLVRVIKP
jgi:hypothetical protein